MTRFCAVIGFLGAGVLLTLLWSYFIFAGLYVGPLDLDLVMRVLAALVSSDDPKLVGLFFRL